MEEFHTPPALSSYIYYLQPTHITNSWQSFLVEKKKSKSNPLYFSISIFILYIARFGWILRAEKIIREEKVYVDVWMTYFLNDTWLLMLQTGWLKYICWLWRRNGRFMITAGVFFLNEWIIDCNLFQFPPR